jgi:tyrosinase
MKAEIVIDGADSTGSNYIAWSPVHATIKLLLPDVGTPPLVKVVLRNRKPAKGGQLVFFGAIPGAPKNQLRLQLPSAGTPVDFFVAGKFGRPSFDDKDAVIEVVTATGGKVLSTTALMVRIRKNANKMKTNERNRFITALAKLNDKGMGKFSDFRNMHVSASSPEAHGDAGFLPWHRAYLLDLERELQAIDPSVALPYWRFDEPAPSLFSKLFIGIPDAGGTVQFDSSNPLQFWATDLTPGIVRTPDFDTSTASAFVIDEASTLALGGAGNTYGSFRNMEGNPHGAAHVSFGGFISSIPTAAKDPLFFLLHANVDRLWAKWQWFNKRFDGTNAATYDFRGKAGDPGATRVGHNLKDTMWPWNGVITAPRPPVAPGGTFAPSPGAAAPGLSPAVRDMIDFQGAIASGGRLGFDYDDVPFEF